MSCQLFGIIVSVSAETKIVRGEYWTSKQRQAHSLHEISYRACFKPQLPEYFIEKYTHIGDLVVDPFLGRGTTCLQAFMMGRRAGGSDVNPLCEMLASPRFVPPSLEDVRDRVESVLLEAVGAEVVEGEREDLLAFFHPQVLDDLLKFKQWFVDREAAGCLDNVDMWVRMVCLNRLTGHSSGFFSVKTMPPNQAVSAKSQRKINIKNGMKPESKDITKIVMKKSMSLLRSSAGSQSKLFDREAAELPVLCTTSADNLYYLDDNSASLIVTSPPFLDIVDYKKDNWLRCWFADINPEDVNISGYSKVGEWKQFVRNVFVEMCRVTKPGGRIAFEVGEVRKGSVKLDECVIDAVQNLPVYLEEVVVNEQQFTKTSNLWGVGNNSGGTNSNRVTVFLVD